jgi:hypothetical protein
MAGLKVFFMNPNMVVMVKNMESPTAMKFYEPRHSDDGKKFEEMQILMNPAPCLRRGKLRDSGKKRNRPNGR